VAVSVSAKEWTAVRPPGSVSSRNATIYTSGVTNAICPYCVKPTAQHGNVAYLLCRHMDTCGGFIVHVAPSLAL
jgi:hypothetical protein